MNIFIITWIRDGACIGFAPAAIGSVIHLLKYNSAVSVDSLNHSDVSIGSCISLKHSPPPGSQPDDLLRPPIIPGPGLP